MLDLVNLANQLACTIDEPPKSKIAKIFNFKLPQMRGPMQNLRTPNFCHCCKEPDTGKRVAVHLRIKEALSL